MLRISLNCLRFGLIVLLRNNVFILLNWSFKSNLVYITLSLTLIVIVLSICLNIGMLNS